MSLGSSSHELESEKTSRIEAWDAVERWYTDSLLYQVLHSLRCDVADRRVANGRLSSLRNPRARSTSARVVVLIFISHHDHVQVATAPPLPVAAPRILFHLSPLTMNTMKSSWNSHVAASRHVLVCTPHLSAAYALPPFPVDGENVFQQNRSSGITVSFMTIWTF